MVILTKWRLDLIPQKIDVVIQAGEILGGQWIEMRRAKSGVMVLKGFELILEIHDWRQIQDALHDIETSHDIVPRLARHDIVA